MGSGTHCYAFDINGDPIFYKYSHGSQHEYMHPGDKFYMSGYAGSGAPGEPTYASDSLLYFDTSIYEPLAEDGKDCFVARYGYNSNNLYKQAIQSQSSVVQGVSVKGTPQ